MPARLGEREGAAGTATDDSLARYRATVTGKLAPILRHALIPGPDQNASLGGVKPRKLRRRKVEGSVP